VDVSPLRVRRSNTVRLGIASLALGCLGAAADAATTYTVPVPRSLGADSTRDTTAWNRLGGGVATIHYTLPVSGHARVRVFDVSGREVARPVDEWQAAGAHVTVFPFGLSAKQQVFRYRVDCGGRKRSRNGRITIDP
jgi:hypothetical protein